VCGILIKTLFFALIVCLLIFFIANTSPVFLCLTRKTCGESTIANSGQYISKPPLSDSSEGVKVIDSNFVALNAEIVTFFFEKFSQSLELIQSIFSYSPLYLHCSAKIVHSASLKNTFDVAVECNDTNPSNIEQ
jgi:hypothetical protein